MWLIVDTATSYRTTRIPDYGVYCEQAPTRTIQTPTPIFDIFHHCPGKHSTAALSLSLSCRRRARLPLAAACCQPPARGRKERRWVLVGCRRRCRITGTGTRATRSAARHVVGRGSFGEQLAPIRRDQTSPTIWGILLRRFAFKMFPSDLFVSFCFYFLLGVFN